MGGQAVGDLRVRRDTIRPAPRASRRESARRHGDLVQRRCRCWSRRRVYSMGIKGRDKRRARSVPSTTAVTGRTAPTVMLWGRRRRKSGVGFVLGAGRGQLGSAAGKPQDRLPDVRAGSEIESAEREVESGRRNHAVHTCMYAHACRACLDPAPSRPGLLGAPVPFMFGATF